MQSSIKVIIYESINLSHWYLTLPSVSVTDLLQSVILLWFKILDILKYDYITPFIISIIGFPGAKVIIILNAQSYCKRLILLDKVIATSLSIWEGGTASLISLRKLTLNYQTVWYYNCPMTESVSELFHYTTCYSFVTNIMSCYFN